MEWMLMPLRRYADFSGRSRRKEYWMFALFQFLLFMVIGISAAMLFGLADPAGTGVSIEFLLLLFIPALFFLVPNVAVTVRRFHDQDKSGWFFLLNFIPYIGSLIVLIFMFLEGTKGPNRFGPDPKGTDRPEAFV